MNYMISCPYCNSENPYYNLTCSNCNSFVRDRVSNLDLWKIIGLLIENPKDAFKQIVFSEHKNFIFFIFFFLSVKLLIDSRFVSLLSIGSFSTKTNLFASYLILGIFLILLFILFGVIFSKLYSSPEFKIKFKDIFSLTIYAQVPHVFALLILFPIEVIVFGDYIFSLNPSPFVIKEFISYLFLSLEILVAVWSIILSAVGFYVHFRRVIPALFLTLIFNGMIILFVYVASLYVFLI